MTMTIAGLSVTIGVMLGLLGGGGSILTVPMLVYLAHVEPKSAIATSLLVVGSTSAVAVLPHARLGNVCWRAGGSFGLAAMAGAYWGGHLAAFIPGQLLMLLFAIMMLATAGAMLLKRRDNGAAANPTCPSGIWLLLSIALQGVFVGCLTGLVGAGGGFVIVPALILLGGLSVHAAVGTSLLIIALNSFSGLAGYLSHMQINFDFAGAITLLTVLGSLAGSRLAPHVSAPALRRGFAVFVIAVAVYLLYREWNVSEIARLLENHAEFWFGGLTMALLVLLYRLSGWLRDKNCLRDC